MSTKLPAVILKPGREKSLLRHHPWVFDGAIAQAPTQATLGETVMVRAADGKPLAIGSLSPQSQIRVRVWTFDPTETIDDAFFQHRLAAAIAARADWLTDPTSTACRLVAAESDGLPGVIVDRYAEVIVCQFLSAGADRWRKAIVNDLVDRFPGYSVYERSDVDVRRKEGLPSQTGVLHGAEPPDLIEIREGSLRLLVDVKTGHKTGFYLDQRENRVIAASLVKGHTVLNCFSYTGGFSLAAIAAGAAHVVNVDASATALELSAKNHQLNGFDPAQCTHLEGDVFQLLRQFRDEGRQFDAIVLDPPKFVEARSHLDRAARGYKDINRLACLLLRPGGLLITFSCSGLLEADLFQKIVADAALDAQREGQILRRLGQSADHPTRLSFPEGFYLKGLVCRMS